jgi:hypothetical protein
MKRHDDAPMAFRDPPGGVRPRDTPFCLQFLEREALDVRKAALLLLTCLPRAPLSRTLRLQGRPTRSILSCFEPRGGQGGTDSES